MSARRLNDEQLAAVEALDGPVLVFAGAGSGKTTVLVERFVRALGPRPGSHEGALDPSRIVTITFTEKAAAELAERIRARLREHGRVVEARAIGGAWVSTIHGFCRRLLKLYALDAGVDPYFTVMDPVRADLLEQEAFAESVLAVTEEPMGARLLASVSTETLLSAVKRVSALLTSHGLRADELTWDACPASGPALIERSRGSLARALQGIRRSGCEKRSVASLAAECERALAELGELSFCADDPERILAAHGVLARFRFGSGRVAREVEQVVARLREEVAEVRDALALCCVEPYLEAFRSLVRAFMASYEQRCRAAGALDFDQLLAVTLETLRRSREVRAACHEAFSLVMVDEFQDTDPLQAAIVDLIAGGSLCTVGDECQSIYSFRGADLDTYREHRERMRTRGATVVELTTNYRSHPDILRFVNEVFGRRELLGDTLLPLRHGRDEPTTAFLPAQEPRVRVLAVAPGQEADAAGERVAECRLLAEELALLRDGHGVRPADMVVLLRAYTHAEEHARALREQGFAVDIAGGGGFFDRPDVRALRAFVRVIANVRDDRALIELLASSMAGLSDDGLALLAMSRRSAEPGSPLWDAVTGEPALCADDMARLARVREAVKRARSLIGARPLAELLMQAARTSGLIAAIEADPIEGERRQADVSAFARMAHDFERQGGVGPAALVRHIEALARLGERVDAGAAAPPGDSAVRIMSIHAAKGLEFPVVAVAGLGDVPRGDREAIRAVYDREARAVRVAMRLSGLPGSDEVEPPTFTRLKEAIRQAELEEEKRLLYVACTRARDVLVLSGALSTASGSEPKQTPFTWLLGDLEAQGLLAAGSRVREHAGIRLSVRSVEVDALAPCGGIAARAPDRRPTVPAGGGGAPRSEPDAPPIQAGTADVPDRLSYSDLSLWLACPRRFRAERLERLGALGPEPRSTARWFGSAVHAILQAMPPRAPFDAARAEAIARSYGLAGPDADDAIAVAVRWRESGLASRIVRMDRIAAEWPFDIVVEAGLGPFVLSGALDLYARRGVDAVIVDYKTGSPDRADATERFELQASCYALAALKDGCASVEVSFVNVGRDAPEPEVLASFRYHERDQGAVERAIASVRDRMIREGFEVPVQPDPRVCASCPANDVVCFAHRAPGFARG